MRHLIKLGLLFSLSALTPSFVAAQSERPLPEVLASADQAWISGKYDDALDRYETVLRRDSTSARVVFRVATVLAWRNDFDRSIALFRLYRQLAPGDADGEVALARTLAWHGRYDQAIALLDTVLSANARQRDAALLSAQVLAWSGHLTDAASRYQAWLADHPNDAEAWVALAQSRRWAGRPEEARQALLRGVAADPNNANARAQLEWTNVDLTPSLEPTMTSTNDNEDNRSTTFLIRTGWAAPWHARLLADASYRVADLGLQHGTATALRTSSSWSPDNGRWTLRGEVGATQLAGSETAGGTQVSRIEPLASVAVSGHVAPVISLGAAVSRAAFDETAPLIRAGIMLTALDAATDVTLKPRISLGGEGSWTRLSGGSGPNDRVAGSGTLRWSMPRFLSFAAGVRGFAYDHAALDGYFSPRSYMLAELSTRLRLGGELGWAFETELGLGDQSITLFGNSSVKHFAQRASASVVNRLAPGMEWGLSGGFANVASAATISSADYRVYTVALKGRVRL